MVRQMMDEDMVREFAGHAVGRMAVDHLDFSTRSIVKTQPSSDEHSHEDDEREEEDLEEEPQAPSLPVKVKGKRGRPRGSRGKKGTRSRKDPRAPKRSKSAYIFFAMNRRDEVKSQLGPKARVGDIAKKTSEMWKALTDKERKTWEDIAFADRERYQEEKASYTGPLLIPGDKSKNGKPEKDPNRPKRPLTAFLYYSQAMRPSLKEKNPTWGIAELSKELGRQWRDMTEAQREPFAQHETEERKKFSVVNAKYKEDKAEEQRKEDETAKEMPSPSKKEKKTPKEKSVPPKPPSDKPLPKKKAKVPSR